MEVTDLKENEVIHCETEEQAKAICKLMHEAGLTWNNGRSYLRNNNFSWAKNKTCYSPKKGTYEKVKHFKKIGYTIHKAEQFLKHKTMTRTRVLFEEVEEKKLKPIEFVKGLNSDFSFSDPVYVKPKDIEELVLVSKDYAKGLDVIVAKKGDFEVLYLGHWNDGIVE